MSGCVAHLKNLETDSATAVTAGYGNLTSDVVGDRRCAGDDRDSQNDDGKHLIHVVILLPG